MEINPSKNWERLWTCSKLYCDISAEDNTWAAVELQRVCLVIMFSSSCDLVPRFLCIGTTSLDHTAQMAVIIRVFGIVLWFVPSSASNDVAICCSCIYGYCEPLILQLSLIRGRWSLARSVLLGSETNSKTKNL